MNNLPFTAVSHVTVLLQNGENLVQCFVIYENRIIAFVGQLLAVDDDLHVIRLPDVCGIGTDRIAALYDAVLNDAPTVCLL